MEKSNLFTQRTKINEVSKNSNSEINNDLKENMDISFMVKRNVLIVVKWN